MNAHAGDLTGAAIAPEKWTQLRRAAIEDGRDVAEASGMFLAYQQTLLDTVSVCALVAVEKSRRTGATWALGADAVLTAAATRADGGMDVLYIGYNLDMAREFVDVAGTWAKSMNKAVGDVEEVFVDGDTEGDKSVKAFRIEFASGFEIVALSSKPRSLRGRQGKVIIDEAAFHEALDEMLKAALALLIWGGRVVVISTHDGEDNPFNELVKDIRSEKRPGAVVRFDFDDALRDGLYMRICEVTGAEWSLEAEAEWRAGIIGFYGDGADEELYVIPARGSGVWLPRALIEHAQTGAPVFRWDCEPGFAREPEHIRRARCLEWCDAQLMPHLQRLDPALEHAFGQDFGRVSDRTVMWPVAITRLLRRETPFIVELGGVPFQQQREVLFYILDRLPRFLSGHFDATGNGAEIAEAAAQRYGFDRISEVKFSVEWYRTTMPPMKAAIEDGTLSLPRDADVLDDFRAIRLVDGVPRVPARVANAGGGTRHGDTAIAAALALAASSEDGAVHDGYRGVSELHRGDRDPDWDGDELTDALGPDRHDGLY